jgi:K+-transporting ATPase KdpF subunit
MSALASSDSSPCGRSPGPSIARKPFDSGSILGLRSGLALAGQETAMFDYLVSGIVAMLLLVYLGWAMFRPERF